MLAELYLLTGFLNAAPTPVKLHYVLTPRLQSGRMTLHVDLEMNGIPHDETELVIPSAWGNATGLTRSIANLTTQSAGTRMIDSSDPAKKILRGYQRGRAHISYDLVKDWDGPLRENARHRAHLDPDYIEINTSNSLIYPAMDQLAKVDCVFDWKLPAQWVLATSFGAGAARQRFRGAWHMIGNAVFVTGDFRLHRSKMGSGTLIVAVRGKWRFQDEEAVSQIAKIILLERGFWKDNDFPYYLVTLVPFGVGQSGSGGSGFTNAFSLHLPPNDQLSAGVMTLLSHEMFHTWNPYKIGLMPSPAEAIYWFTEGFTKYYEDLLLFRSGMLPMEGYLQAVNRIIRDYSLSPAKNVTLRELIERARTDQVKGQISYERGALTALWLDSRIRRASEGRSSLDTLMFDLFRQARARKGPPPSLTPERVFQAASHYLDAADLRQFRSYVETGATIEAPAEAFGPCVVRELVEMPAFELGMDRTALVENRTVTGLKPGSEAQKAGLREGDIVNGTSVNWNDTSKRVKLTVRRNGEASTFEYYPRGPSIGFIPQYFVNRARPTTDDTRYCGTS